MVVKVRVFEELRVEPLREFSVGSRPEMETDVCCWLSIKNDSECGGTAGFCSEEIGAGGVAGLVNGDAVGIVFIDVGDIDGDGLVGGIASSVGTANDNDVGVVVCGVTKIVWALVVRWRGERKRAIGSDGELCCISTTIQRPGDRFTGCKAVNSGGVFRD